ncbi:division/cell wall cluster transcriptional repressor MraZ [Carboxylicivirga sp. M1479]|uniref:division/cell wall cluster transcriptional repressor MraZ n=1 Tax=Carboxylicivirga sp. M1479 TaxID=2594476 RepID=UPI001177D199|nr:division/cell wall cluster transcriptional repressor MraZ [Carboxylicivirga sp. M1479]TRX71862.1 division/cell wall cluster transcriptional repressor MraZ [Carboxylicivirga sp. M1479]
MTTFIGDFVCKPDAKGRVVLPSVFKKLMSDEGQSAFVVRKDLFDHCLVLIPQNEWQKEVKLVEEKLSGFRQKDKRLKRALYRSTAEVKLDANGRFLVPKRLMDLVEVDAEVVLLGVGNSIELWSKAHFDDDGLDGDELGELAEELLGGNFADEKEN